MNICQISKEQCHEMDIFRREKHFNQYFLCMRLWFSRLFNIVSLPYTISNFLFASLKLLTNFEDLTKTILEIPFFSYYFGDFYIAITILLTNLSYRNACCCFDCMMHVLYICTVMHHIIHLSTE